MYPLYPAVTCFPLGEILVTASALAVLTKFEIAHGLKRHAKGDWGDLSQPQRNKNDRALKHDRRIASTYLTKTRKRFDIITEADRSQTIIQLHPDTEPAMRPASRDAQASAVRASSARVSHRKLPASNRWTATESEVEQLDLFKLNPLPAPPRRRKPSPQEWKVVSLRECPAPESMIQMDRPQKAEAYWRLHIASAPDFNADVECVAVLFLNTKLRIKGHYVVSKGVLNEALVQPREVFRLAIMAAAYGIVLMHNHPSGEPEPSDADRAFTRRVSDAGHILRIELCDHVIVGHDRYFSFRESGLLK